MLSVKNITKKYVTGELVQKALDGVSLRFRDNEFVAVLGPSGSGKTTLLNIIGGLDQYDEGDLIINGVSTRQYRSKEWDAYRNHTIGFVFQSYNLITHQSILANVELALTISGITKKERRIRAKKALEQVGLGNQIHKKPNQMSGGQMQRVAIARALINNPDILLADEPTGALDSDTSVQVMELLKEVAKERLVIMVTHNPELADSYANRIVRLKDGKVVDDSNPCEEGEVLQAATITPQNKVHMSFLTALSLSFSNLRTKKGRSILTAFAGSIGIIGIALILAISSGVNNYVMSVQQDTMSSYPITIEESTVDATLAFVEKHNEVDKELNHELDGVYSNGSDLEKKENMNRLTVTNDLKKFKEYLDRSDNQITPYVGESGIVYSYNTKFGVYTYDSKGSLINTDGSSTDQDQDSTITESPFQQMMSQETTSNQSNKNFQQMLAGTGEELVSPVVKDNYNLIYGNWPSAYNEVILVVDANNEIATKTLCDLGIMPLSEYQEVVKNLENNSDVKVNMEQYSYDTICQQQFHLVPDCDTYMQREDGSYCSIKNDAAQMKQLVDNALPLKVVGIIRPTEGADNAMLQSSVCYTKALSDYMIQYSNESPIVKAQKDNPSMNVMNGISFNPQGDEGKAKDLRTYTKNMDVSEKTNLCKQIATQQLKDNSEEMQQLMLMNEVQLAQMLDTHLEQSNQAELAELYDHLVPNKTYDDIMDELGMVDLDSPAAISIYPNSFEDKDKIADQITQYNSNVSEEEQIRYVDYVKVIMSSVTTIVDVISYVLIAFVGVSLIVSSIMIGIITYISVLERTKEIGILRALGASKHNIAQVFNAETFIIGFLSGLLGIGITYVLLIPVNALLASLIETQVTATLTIGSAAILVGLSIMLTLLGGFIPSRKAAMKDPVTALRTE